MKTKGFENWVTVFEAANIDQANIVKGLLTASNIPVFLEREAIGVVIAAGPFNEVAVKVPREKAELAGKLLQTTPYGVVSEE